MFLVFATRKVIGMSIAAFLLSFPLIFVDWAPSEHLHQAMMPWDPWLQRVTILGDGRFLTPLCVLVFSVLWAKKRPEKVVPLLAMLAMATSGALSHLMKFSFGRARPFLLNDPRYPGIDFTQFHWFAFHSDFASFPSGHTAAVFSVAWVFANMRWARESAWGARSVMILLIAVAVTLSRVALAKHFYADVLAGAALGVGFAQVVLRRFGKLEGEFKF